MMLQSLRSRLVTRWQAMLTLLSLGLLLTLLLGSLPPLAAQTQMPSSVDKLEQWQQKVDQYRTGLSEQKERFQQLEGLTQKQIKGLQQNTQITNQQIQASEARIEQANQQLKQLTTDLAVAENAYKQKRAATAARLRFLQRQPTASGWTALLQSQTLNQFLSRRYQLKRVYEADQQQLVGLKTQADGINTQKTQIEGQKNQIALLKEQLLTRKQTYESQTEVHQKLLTRLNTNRRALEAAEDQLAQDSQNLTAWIQYRQALRTQQGGVVAYGTGQMGYPSRGPITSPFGWRLHPVLGSSRFHSGTDFGAEYGTPIYASDRGTVLFAGWYGGYGNAVVIDHGKGLTTLYGHASQLSVSAGQVVQRGQAIAAVGSSGLSTGPHLHFEVRQNGQPVDPLAFL